ncbi:hypothetical protein [Liquorilactobacillus capillatus]|nr:hypothetical protein [Liquorilactobacillus capillatus]
MYMIKLKVSSFDTTFWDDEGKYYLTGTTSNSEKYQGGIRFNIRKTNISDLVRTSSIDFTSDPNDSAVVDGNDHDRIKLSFA